MPCCWAVSSNADRAGVGLGAGGVVLTTGTHLKGPDRPPVGGGHHLDVAAVMLMFSRPPKVRAVGAGRAHPVGAHQGAVQVQVRESGRPQVGQRLGQVRRLSGQHVDPLVQAGGGRALADPIVGGELENTGVVGEPPQHQDRLRERAQRTSALAGAKHTPVRGQ